jgi:hypothetical protein
MITLLLSLAQANWASFKAKAKGKMHAVSNRFHHAVNMKFFEHDRNNLEKMVAYVEKALGSKGSQSRAQIVKDERVIRTDIEKYKKDFASKYGEEKTSGLVSRAEAVLQKLQELKTSGE